MRRLVALLVFALVGATLYGFSSFSSGLKVNDSTVSGNTLRSELAAITSNQILECYVTALDPVNFGSGAGGASMNAAGAAAWANLRVEGLSIDNFATKNLHYHPNAAALAKARTSLEGELSAASAALTNSAGQSTPCPGTSTQALNAMTPEMRTFEIAAQAASLDLVAKLNGTIPLNLTSMKQYYSTHASDYICVSVAVVAPTQVTAFEAAEKSGMSVAALAKKFSADPSGQTGGAYGCFGPSSSSYSGVQTATKGTPINTFGTTPEQITYEGQTAALFVARTPSTFAKAESAVYSDLQSANASAANLEKERILFESAIGIDPAIGRWGFGSNGPSVFAPALPASGVVGSTTIAALTVGAATYK